MRIESNVAQTGTTAPTVGGTALVKTDDTRLASDRTRKITIQSTAPASPATGDLWLDTST